MNDKSLEKLFESQVNAIFSLNFELKAKNKELEEIKSKWWYKLFSKNRNNKRIFIDK